MVHSGLSSLSLPTAKEAPHVTCTGVPYDPDTDELKTVFRTIWTTPPLLLNKAQTAMKSEIVDVFDISIFPKQNKIFPGSDLLQKLWKYLFGRVHRNRSLILQHAEKWFLTSLATADDFHTAIFKFQAIQTCKNLLGHTSPLETNPDTMLQLLQGLRNNVASVPPTCRRDFITILEALLHAAADGDTPDLSTLTIALGPIYPDPTLPRPSADEIASLAYAHQQPTPRSSADSRRSTTDTVLQSFERAPDETAFLARPAFGKPGYTTDASSKDARDSRKDDRYFRKAARESRKDDYRNDSRPPSSWDHPRRDSSPDRPPSSLRRTDDARLQEIVTAQQKLQSLVAQLQLSQASHAAHVAVDVPVELPVHEEATYHAELQSGDDESPRSYYH